MTNQVTVAYDTAVVSMVVLYHSNYGHTRRVALAVAEGARAVGISVQAIDVMTLVRYVAGTDDTTYQATWHDIDQANILVFASAVYMGSVTADFKAFMELTSKRWFTRQWQGKLAAGIANSGGLSGDKLPVLQQLCLFAMQHGMHWVGMPLMPTGHGETDLNRLSGFLGLMVQSLDAPADKTPCVGDMKSAVWFGEYLAQTALRCHYGHSYAP